MKNTSNILDKTEMNMKKKKDPVILTSEDHPEILSPKEKESGLKRTLIIHFDNEETEEK